MALPPSAPQRVMLRPVTPGDRFVIRRWLGLPHVAAWLGSTGAAEASVALATDMASAICRIIEVDGAPVGYAHAFDDDAAASVTLSRPACGGIPAGAWLAELFIADPGLRGRGVGRSALDLLRGEVFSTTLAPALVMRASVRHERQVRALEQAGFAWRAMVADPLLGQAWLLLAERPR